MGTDISMFAEVRRDGHWVLAEPIQPNGMYTPDVPELGPQRKPKNLYQTRCRELFAILANVGNPIRAKAPFDFISEPRGLPSDASKELLDWHNHWKGDAFAESWLLLEELLAFDWHGKTILRRGVVNPAAAHLFPPGRIGFPNAEWPTGIPISAANQGSGVEVTWIDTYAQAVGQEFVDRTLTTLQHYGSPGLVRIVFWFDA
jgi:hypothetical protein